MLTIDSSKLSFVGSIQNLLVKYFRLFIFALFEVTRGQVVHGFAHVRIVSAQTFFINF